MTDDLERSVVQHYGRAGLKERVLAGIVAAGLDVDHLKADDLAPVDEFHTGGRGETVHALARLQLRPDDRVLDVGCGLGGTARYIAANFGAHVSGIDLTPDYIELAKLLSAYSGLADRTDFKVANALQMPFESRSFEAVVTFHVAMNIKDRPELYREIARVMKTGTALCIYDVMRGPRDGVEFPVPWAETPANSHLTSVAEMRALLVEAGFEMIELEDRKAFAIEFFRKRLASKSAPPPLGLHLLTGENTREKFENYLRGLESDAIAPTIMTARRS